MAGPSRKRKRPQTEDETQHDPKQESDALAACQHEDAAGVATEAQQPAVPVQKSKAGKKLTAWRRAYNRRGVVYISRIPPHMKPQKLRHLLEQHGAIDRIYCAPEDPALRKARKRAGGNTGRNFTEGWVEFEDKKVAKRVAATLNSTPMGGKRRSAYHFDLWTLKYLPKFKWDQLTEEIAYENAVREQKLAAEVSAAKRERDYYLSRVDKAKAVEAMRERKQNKKRPHPEGTAAQDLAVDGSSDTPAKLLKHKPAQQPRHSFGQRHAKADPAEDAADTMLSAETLALIAGDA